MGRWTEHLRQDLELFAGAFPFRLWLEEVLGDDNLYTEAWIGGRWVPASWWQHDAKYLSALAVHAEAQADAPRVAANMRTRWRRAEGRRPGLGEAAWHLVAHLQYARPLAIETAALAKFYVDSDDWTQQVNNGRKRENAGKPCRFC